MNKNRSNEKKSAQTENHLNAEADKCAPYPRIRMLLGLAAEHRILLAFAALLMGVSASATALYAYLMGPMLKTLFLGTAKPIPVPETLGFVERIAHRFQHLDPLFVGLAIVGAAAVKAAAFFGHSFLSAAVGQRLLHRLRCRLFQGLLSMNPLDPKTRDAGDWTVRFTSDVTQIEEAVTKGIVAYFQHGIEVIALAILALSLDPWLGLLGLIAFPPSAAVILRLGKKIRLRRAAAHQAVGDLGTAVAETACGLAAIRAFGAEEAFLNRFFALSRAISGAVTRAAALRAAGSPLNEILGATALAATLVWAARRIAANDLAPEAFISFFSALFLLYQPVKGLGHAHHAVEWGIAALSRISPFLRNAPFSRSAPASLKPKSIVLQGVETGYDDRIVLTNITMTIAPGERIAVVGPSGAGKTTLFNLLLGLLPARRGAFILEDRPFQESDFRTFAPVRQEPFLFDDTIIENVRIGAPDASFKEIETACRSAGVWEFTSAMTDGLYSRVGPFGQSLSLGQRQRVCLARALISGAPVLLLDEVTASIDGETEQSVIEGLREQPEDRTVIIVTHRLSTAKWADRMILIDNGTIAADGPASVLLSSDPRMAALFGDQSM